MSCVSLYYGMASRQISVLSQSLVPEVDTAENAWLSRLFACLDSVCRPLTISGSPSLLNTAYNYFAGLSQMLLVFKVYGPWP